MFVRKSRVGIFLDVYVESCWFYPVDGVNRYCLLYFVPVDRQCLLVYRNNPEGSRCSRLNIIVTSLQHGSSIDVGSRAQWGIIGEYIVVMLDYRSISHASVIVMFVSFLGFRVCASAFNLKAAICSCIFACMACDDLASELSSAIYVLAARRRTRWLTTQNKTVRWCDCTSMYLCIVRVRERLQKQILIALMLRDIVS